MAFTSKLFWKLFGVYSLLSVIAALCIITIIGQRQREIVFDQVHRRLQHSAATVLNLLEEPFKENPDVKLLESLKTIAAQNETRITLIAQDGSVIVDSEREPKTMENHGDRADVLQAKASGIGSSHRSSPTLGIPMMYLAIRAGDADAPSGHHPTGGSQSLHLLLYSLSDQVLLPDDGQEGRLNHNYGFHHVLLAA